MIDYLKDVFSSTSFTSLIGYRYNYNCSDIKYDTDSNIYTFIFDSCNGIDIDPNYSHLVSIIIKSCVKEKINEYGLDFIIRYNIDIETNG